MENWCVGINPAEQGVLEKLWMDDPQLCCRLTLSMLCRFGNQPQFVNQRPRWECREVYKKVLLVPSDNVAQLGVWPFDANCPVPCNVGELLFDDMEQASSKQVQGSLIHGSDVLVKGKASVEGTLGFL